MYDKNEKIYLEFKELNDTRLPFTGHIEGYNTRIYASAFKTFQRDWFPQEPHRIAVEHNLYNTGKYVLNVMNGEGLDHHYSSLSGRSHYYSIFNVLDRKRYGVLDYIGLPIHLICALIPAFFLYMQKQLNRLGFYTSVYSGSASPQGYVPYTLRGIFLIQIPMIVATLILLLLSATLYTLYLTTKLVLHPIDLLINKLVMNCVKFAFLPVTGLIIGIVWLKDLIKDKYFANKVENNNEFDNPTSHAYLSEKGILKHNTAKNENSNEVTAIKSKSDEASDLATRKEIKPEPEDKNTPRPK